MTDLEEEVVSKFSPPNTNYHHKQCPCSLCTDKHYESCTCRKCVPEVVAISETVRQRLVTVNSTKPTTYAEGYFKTQPVKDYGAVPRLMMALARKKPDNGWAWYALAFGRFVCFEAYWPDVISSSE